MKVKELEPVEDEYGFRIYKEKWTGYSNEEQDCKTVEDRCR